MAYSDKLKRNTVIGTLLLAAVFLFGVPQAAGIAYNLESTFFGVVKIKYILGAAAALGAYLMLKKEV